MSNSTLTPQAVLQDQGNVLGPCIAGLFLQGLVTGLVIAHFSRWFSSPERNDSVAFSVLVIFVTIAGFFQTGLSFASTWSKSVQHFGQPVTQIWVDYFHAPPTQMIAIPVQALMIRRCYYAVGKNPYIIAPLVLLLLTSAALSIWVTVNVLRFQITSSTKDYSQFPESFGVSYPYMTFLIVPSILDVSLTCILLYYLSRTMKQVYTARIHRRLSRLMGVVWQSAIPPTVCTIVLCIVYVQSITARQVASYTQEKQQPWYAAIRGLVGKLYLISLFYTINDSDVPALPGEHLPTFVPTLTVPIEVHDTISLETRVSGAVSCHDTIQPPYLQCP